jgi:hypothetical protein
VFLELRDDLRHGRLADAELARRTCKGASVNDANERVHGGKPIHKHSSLEGFYSNQVTVYSKVEYCLVLSSVYCTFSNLLFSEFCAATDHRAARSQKRRTDKWVKSLKTRSQS